MAQVLPRAERKRTGGCGGDTQRVIRRERENVVLLMVVDNGFRNRGGFRGRGRGGNGCYVGFGIVRTTDSGQLLIQHHRINP